MRGNARSNNTSQTSLPVGSRGANDEMARARCYARRRPTACMGCTSRNAAYFCPSGETGPEVLDKASSIQTVV